jgi:hypothetical protein
MPRLLKGSWPGRSGSLLTLTVVAAAVAALAATTASAHRVAPATATAQQCGQDVSYVNKIKDPDGAFKKLPPEIQKRSCSPSARRGRRT